MIGKINLDINDITQEDTIKYRDIFSLLAASGALKLSGAKITIHLGSHSKFQGIEVNYWPVKRMGDDSMASNPNLNNSLK